MKSSILVAGVAATVVLATTQLTFASTITLNFETKLEHAVTQLDHAHDPQKALAHFETKLEHMPGVNVFIDNPAVHTEEFIGTDGQHDVFVFDASVKTVNVALLKNFDPGEDYLLFANMDSRDLTIGDLGELSNGDPIGINAVLFHDNGASANILMFGVPYEQQVIEHMILKFDGRLVYNNPFIPDHHDAVARRSRAIDLGDDADRLRWPWVRSVSPEVTDRRSRLDRPALTYRSPLVRRGRKLRDFRNASSKSVHATAGRSDDLGRSAAVGNNCRMGPQHRVTAGPPVFIPRGTAVPSLCPS